jgi:hypothetical protein
MMWTTGKSWFVEEYNKEKEEEAQIKKIKVASRKQPQQWWVAMLSWVKKKC